MEFISINNIRKLFIISEMFLEDRFYLSKNAVEIWEILSNSVKVS